jgi:hypothetical protein
MPRPLSPFRIRSSGLALVAAASVALLSGCTPGPAEPAGSNAPSGTPSASASAAGTPAPTETAEPATPFAIDCATLVTPDQLYAFNPNFGTDPGFEPSAANVVAVVEEDEGTACGYLNQTSGEVIEIAVATPTTSAGEARRNAAATTSKPVPTYGTPPDVEGYFLQAGGTGQAQVFHGPYWIVVDSAAIFEPGDAQQLVTAVLGNLPAA